MLVRSSSAHPRKWQTTTNDIFAFLHIYPENPPWCRQRASGGGHDRRVRVSKSEPVPATAAERKPDMRHSHTRNMGSAGRGPGGGSGEQLYTSREPSDSGWPSRSTAQSAAGAGTGRFAGPDRDHDHVHTEGGEWTSRENPGLPLPEMLGGGGNSTIHSLLRNAGVAPRGTGTGARANGDGSDELGGESTFLAAHPMDSGLVASQGEGLGMLGRGAVGHF